MNCKQAKSQIALWVGNDLDEADLPELKRHVAQCVCCEGYCAQMQAGLDVLQQADEMPHLPMQGSLWPRVAASIHARGLSPRAHRFNGWVPAAAVAAACVAILLSALQRPVERRPEAILTDVFGTLEGQGGANVSPFVIDQNGRIFRDSWQNLPQNPSANDLRGPRGLTLPTRTAPLFPYHPQDRGGF